MTEEPEERYTMNYAKAVTLSIGKERAVDIIQSQAQLELGRCLTALEKSSLSSKYSLDALPCQITKV